MNLFGTEAEPWYFEHLDTIVSVCMFVVGMVTQHLYFRHQIERIDKRDRFREAVILPVEAIIGAIDDTISELRVWNASGSTEASERVFYQGVRASRSFSRRLSLLDGSEFGCDASWLSISTDDVDAALSRFSDPEATPQVKQTAARELDWASEVLTRKIMAHVKRCEEAAGLTKP